MKDQILKIAKVKNEAEFYRKYPTEEAFMKAHGKAFKKAAMGAKMVNDQLHQLTDFGNPPTAQVGTYIGGGRDSGYNPGAFTDAITIAKSRNAGISVEEQKKRDSLEQVEAQSQKEDSGGGGIIDIVGGIAGKFLGGGGGGGELPDFEDLGLEPLEYGGELHKAQFGGGISGIGQMLGKGFESKGGLGSGLVDMFGGNSKGITSASQKMFSGAGGAMGGLKQLGTSAGLKTAGSAAGMGLLNAVPQILGGFGQMEEQKNAIKKADQFAQLSGVTASAAESQPDQIKRKYVRPEDALVQPGQLGDPQGTGTNYLAQNGKSIGGNETEVQNTYAPNDIYVGLGYEPLTNNNIKQYQLGGSLFSNNGMNTNSFGGLNTMPNQGMEQLGRGRFQNGGDIPTAEFGDYFQDSGQASIGKGVGTAIGSVFGPLGGAVGGFLGGIAGNLFGGADDANRLKNLQDVGRKNTERAAWAQGASSIHAQNANVMKDGGYTDEDHKWISNGWNPQVITHFGNMNVSQVHDFAHQGMDSLRAGGHLKEYTPPSAEAMYTGKSQMAMGGDLKTHWGGEAETLSHNPYLPDGGETVMFRGQSHDETDGKGRSGIGVTYGDSPVEVERGEPAVKLQDGGNAGEDNLVVFGNMMIPDYGVKELEDKNAKGKKFKNYVADLSKKEAKHNKTIEKATEIVNNANGNDPFDQLSLNAGKAMIMGANAKLKDIADKKQKAAMVQNAILDTAEEFGVESDGLAKGKIRPIKDPSIGRDGKKLKKAQSGDRLDFKDLLKTPDRASAFVNGAYNLSSLNGLDDLTNLDPITREAIRRGMIPPKGMPGSGGAHDLDEVVVAGTRKKKKEEPIEEPIEWPDLPGPFTPDQIAKGKKKSNINWKDIASTALTMYPFFRPTNQEPLDPSQLTGEMYALGNNQLQGVQAQTYQPMLDQPYDISLQDQLNAIDGQARAAILAAGQDPAAQSVIMAQASDLKNKVLGEQFRANQANKAAVYQANRQALNQAQLQNLGILDTQYGRQETAKSKTKAETMAALNSISDKIAKNKLENRQLGVMENMYNYRYDSQGRAYNINNPAQFNIPELGLPDPNLMDNGRNDGTVPVYDNKGNIISYKVIQPTKTATKKRNGSIVKAIKNL
jgi:hypothetical protein